MEMLGFVTTHYPFALDQEETRLIEKFRELPTPAQCLYVRLVNRKGRIFAINKLRYPELGDVRAVVDTLGSAGWLVAPQTKHFDDILAYLTRAEISAVLQQLVTGVGRSLKKPELIDIAREHCKAAEFMKRLNCQRLFVQNHVASIQYLLFLYFGRVQDSLSQFTMRDLGLVTTKESNDNFEPRFNDRAEAQEFYFYARRLYRLASKTPGSVQALTAEISQWPEPTSSGCAALRDKLAQRLGRQLQRQGDSSDALQVYLLGESATCSERAVRLMLADDRRDEAQEFLERCMRNPRSDEEALIAEDLYLRKFRKKRTSTLTDALRDAECIELDESGSGNAERAAIAYFQDQGAQAWRSENLLWRTFFGLLFWQELFESDNAVRHSPFEFLPAALIDGSFGNQNSKRIAEKLKLLQDKAALKRALLKVSTSNYGKANGIFRWRRSIIEALFELVDVADSDAMAVMLRRLCDDYSNMRHGYPDLFLIDHNGPRFVEIKAEGDQLRRNQWLRIQQLQDAGFAADIVRVRWVLDPAQVYVVVDVETTGGRGEQHRVTEIGAVKVQNGKITDRFQTLLNPERGIPAAISRLTGITPAMVAKAPAFSQIADSFRSFMGDAIFVAHNVEFDYGFISREFQRLGQPFRHAKLCTCASMRKLYPGHRSYNLAALCSIYDIRLQQHHRALCDAEAAAELLLLVNEKRGEKLS